ncbi:MAG: S-layer homology domain-containing protein [Oscillospiraceae bacterium]|jgi:hypothetical protein|nr:S-layer homology domain-containing protein [Oscillospiraceae bacterium]
MQRPRKSPLAKILALTLTFAMLLGIAITATAAPAYPDISGHWGETAIEKWSAYDVLHGNDLGTFDPDGELDVTQLAQILVNTFGYTESYTGSLSGYSSTWGEEAVRKAVAAGAIEASEAALPLTRELAAKIVAKAFGIAPVSGASKFSDDYAISSEYKPYAAALGRAGIFNGNDYGELMPSETFSRAAIMQAMDNAVTDLVKENKAAESAKSVIINKGGVTLTEGTIEGDLIIAQGVGDGEVTLDGVTVKGRLVILGAGSVHIKGKSGVSNVVADKTFGQPARVAVESADATVGTVTVIAESKATVATTNNAAVSKVTIAPKTQVSATGELTDVTTAAAATVTISAKVETLAVETKATVTVSSGATVAAATIEASDVKLSGAGKVTAVTVTADAKTGVEVRTSGTKVTVDKDAGAVTTSSGKIEPGKTATTGSSSSSSGGGGYTYNPGSGTGDPEPEITVVSIGLSPTEGWGSIPEGEYEEYTLYESDGEYEGGEVFWIDGSDGYTLDELNISEGNAQYFIKAEYDNYTWGSTSGLELLFATEAQLEEEPAEHTEYVLANASDTKLYVTADTIYYFGEILIANGGEEDDDWEPNETFDPDVPLPVLASILEGTVTEKASAEELAAITWPELFEVAVSDLTEGGELEANRTWILKEAKEVPNGKTLTVDGTIIVQDEVTFTVTGTIDGEGTIQVAGGATVKFADSTSKLDGTGTIAVAEGGAVVAPAGGIPWETEAGVTIEYTAGATAAYGDPSSGGKYFIGASDTDAETIIFTLTNGTITQSETKLTIDGEAAVSEHEVGSDEVLEVNGTLTIGVEAELTFADGSELAGEGVINLTDGAGTITGLATGIPWGTDSAVIIVYGDAATLAYDSETIIGDEGVFQIEESGTITQTAAGFTIDTDSEVTVSDYEVKDTLTVNGELTFAETAELVLSDDNAVLAGTGTLSTVDGGGTITLAEGKGINDIPWGADATVAIVYGSYSTLQDSESAVLIGSDGIIEITSGTLTQSATSLTFGDGEGEEEAISVTGELAITGNLTVGEGMTLTIAADGGILDVSAATTVTITGDVVIEAGGVLAAGETASAVALYTLLGVAEAVDSEDPEGVVLTTESGATITLTAGAVITMTTGQADMLTGALSDAGATYTFVEGSSDDVGKYTLTAATTTGGG